MIFIDFPRNKNLIQISKIKNYLHKTAEMLIPQIYQRKQIFHCQIYLQQK